MFTFPELKEQQRKPVGLAARQCLQQYKVNLDNFTKNELFRCTNIFCFLIFPQFTWFKCVLRANEADGQYFRLVYCLKSIWGFSGNFGDLFCQSASNAFNDFSEHKTSVKLIPVMMFLWFKNQLGEFLT